MTKRIKITLAVLKDLQNQALETPKPAVEQIDQWRREAIVKFAKPKSAREVKGKNAVAEGVNPKTVDAQLVGQISPVPIGRKTLAALIHGWIVNDSKKLEDWLIESRPSHEEDQKEIRRFFQRNEKSPRKNRNKSKSTAKKSRRAAKTSDRSSDVETTEPLRKRIERDLIQRKNGLARQAKEQSNYACEICGGTILLSDGRRYAEAHHIKPLGQPHTGRDRRDNIVCVCPNCHVKLDYGAMRLNKSKLRHVAAEYITYHNDRIYIKRSARQASNSRQ